MKLFLWLFRFLPKLRDLLIAEFAQERRALQERLEEYSRLAAASAVELNQYKIVNEALSQDNLALRVQLTQQSQVIEQRNNEIARLKDAVEKHLRAIDGMRPADVWDASIATEDGRTVVAESGTGAPTP